MFDLFKGKSKEDGVDRVLLTHLMGLMNILIEKVGVTDKEVLSVVKNSLAAMKLTNKMSKVVAEEIFERAQKGEGIMARALGVRSQQNEMDKKLEEIIKHENNKIY